nr:MAG TPA: hypothetical protein [Caudoviricetes sp.]
MAAAGTAYSTATDLRDKLQQVSTGTCPAPYQR